MTDVGAARADGEDAFGHDGVLTDVRTAVRFTVDVEGDWAGRGTRGIDEVLPRLIELLDAHGSRATFFVVGDLAERVRPHLSPGGPHEVGSHSLTHPVLTRIEPREVQREVVGSRTALEALGYEVMGFRAPFFARPDGLGSVLADAGYAYDASVGSVLPFRRARPGPCEPLPAIPPGHLRDGRSPFALTTLRILHPAGRHLVGAKPDTFTCHLHELLVDTPGWTALPPGLRGLHRRGHGAVAWRVLEQLLGREDLRFTSCRDHPDAPEAA